MPLHGSLQYRGMFQSLGHLGQQRHKVAENSISSKGAATWTCNALTGQLGTRRNLSGNATYRPLEAAGLRTGVVQLLWQADAAEQVLKARVRAQAVHHGVYTKLDHAA
jgi:hypothetical protein